MPSLGLPLKAVSSTLLCVFCEIHKRCGKDFTTNSRSTTCSKTVKIQFVWLNATGAIGENGKVPGTTLSFTDNMTDFYGTTSRLQHPTHQHFIKFYHVIKILQTQWLQTTQAVTECIIIQCAAGGAGQSKRCRYREIVTRLEQLISRYRQGLVINVAGFADTASDLFCLE